MIIEDKDAMSSPKPTLDDLRIERKAKRSSSSKIWWILPLVLALIVTGTILWFKAPKVVKVRTVTARETSGPSTQRTVLNASGYVTARRAATVSSKVTGKVIEVDFEEGLKVKEGQVLARIDDTNVKASLRLAEAQLDSSGKLLEETRVRVKEAEAELRRIENLVQNKIATQADFEHAEATALSLKAKLEQQKADVIVAERQVASWQQQVEDTVIRAPFAGIVTSKNAQPGEMISPISAGGGFTRTGICTIVDMSSLEIEVDVNEGYINRVEAGQPVEAMLDAYPEWKIPCKVIAIIPTADRQKATVKVRVGFENLESRVLPEMSVKVGFRDATSAPAARRAITLPKSAVQQKEGKDVVLVVSNGRAERRAVTVSNSFNDEVAVSAGLTAGERVIIDAPQGLGDGASVREVTP
jgi:RND family efflux transporter MFP subunit